MDDDPTHQLTLSHAAYGKDGIRVLITAERSDGADTVRDCSFRVSVSGRFEASYVAGDNATILPSDTLRRHLLATAASAPERSLESICHAAAERLLGANPHIALVLIEASERPWDPGGIHTFTAAAAPLVAACEWSRGGDPTLRGGVEGLDLLLTRGSAFTGFRRDALTVQREAHDRPLGGTLSAQWTFTGAEPPARDASSEILVSLLAALSDRRSNGVQQWITAAGAAVLNACAAVSEIGVRFASTSIVQLPADLAPAPAATLSAYELTAGPVGVTEVQLARR